MSFEERLRDRFSEAAEAAPGHPLDWGATYARARRSRTVHLSTVAFGTAVVLAAGVFGVRAVVDERGGGPVPFGPTSPETPSPSSSPSPSGEPGPEETDPYSDASTWRRIEGDPSLVADLLSSCSGRTHQTECVTDFMRDHGAKEEAVDFYRTTQTFLVLFKESGAADVGIVLDPWLVNNNTRTVLLNGDPSIFEPHESEAPAGVRRDSEFDSARETFPNLDLGVQFPFLETARRDNQGSRYIFQFYLEDGCHACDTGLRARVVFRVDEDGRHGGGRYLGMCNSNEQSDTPADLSHIPGCPSPPDDLYPGFEGGPR